MVKYTKGAKVNTLKIYQTSDIHGHIYPTNYVTDLDLGLAKIDQLINDEAGDSQRLVIDSGDYIQGSPLCYYTQKQQPDFSLYNGLNKVGYDCITLGNHEFNYGLEYLKTQVSGFDNDILCANITGLPFATKPYQIYNFDNLKVGVIGFTTTYIPHWENADNISGLEFNDIIETYRKYEPILVEQCDIIIVNYHGGFESKLDNCDCLEEKDTGENIGSKLVTTFPSIDIILSGHQHRQFLQMVNNTLCGQPGCFGKFVNEITIDLDTKKIIDYRQISTADYQPSTLILETFKEVHDNCNIFLDTKLANCDTDLRINDVHLARRNGHPFISLLGEIFQEEVGGDIVAVSIFDSAIGFASEITIRQVCQNYPFPNTLYKLAITGKDVIAAISQSNNYYQLIDRKIDFNPKYITPKIKHYNYDIFYGISYKVIIGSNENVITDVLINNSPIDLDATYEIVVSNYRYHNRDDYPVYANTQIIHETKIEASEIIINYLLAHQSIKFDNKLDYKLITNP